MLNIETRGDTCHVALQGELTIYQAAELAGTLLPRLDCREPMVVDLSEVSDMDTSCAQVLMVAKRARLAHGRSFALTEHSQAVIDAFETLGLVSWFGDPVVLKGEQSRRAPNEAGEGAST